MPKDKCCEKCMWGDQFNESLGCCNPQCKCHSPIHKGKAEKKDRVKRESLNFKTLSNNQAEHRTIPANPQEPSPSSFEDELYEAYGNRCFGDILDVIKKYCLDKSIVERDYINKVDLIKKHIIGIDDFYIEKQKVLDALEKAFIIFPEHRKLVNWLKEELL